MKKKYFTKCFLERGRDFLYKNLQKEKKISQKEFRRK